MVVLWIQIPRIRSFGFRVVHYCINEAPPSEPTGFSVRFSSEMQVLRSNTHKGRMSVSALTLRAGPQVRIKGNITVYASLRTTWGGGESQRRHSLSHQIMLPGWILLPHPRPGPGSWTNLCMQLISRSQELTFLVRYQELAKANYAHPVRSGYSGST